jgi:hypothetical protein
MGARVWRGNIDGILILLERLGWYIEIYLIN